MYKPDKKYLDAIVIFVVLFLVLLYRRHDAFINPQLWAEDGTIIFKEWEMYHWGSLTIFYVGTLMTVARLVAAIVGLLHVSYYYVPHAYVAGYFIVTYFVALGLWKNAVRLNVKHRVLYATLFVLLPVGNELFMTEGSLTWICGIYLVNYIFAWDNKVNEKYYYITLIILFIIATSGPFSAVMFPVTMLLIFLNRKEASLKRLVPLFVIGVGGIIQLIGLKFIQPYAFKGRVESWNFVEKDHFHLMKVFTKNISELLYFNTPLVPQMPDRLKTVLSLLVFIGFIIFFVKSYRKIEYKNKYILVLAAFLFFCSFLVAYWPKESKILGLEIARYHLIPYMCIGWMVIMAWDNKIKIEHIVVYVYFLFLHSGFIRTAFPDKNWKGQVKDYYEGKTGYN